MLRTFEAEMKKLKSSKILWLIFVGATLPPVITYLSFFKQADISWQIFLHVAMLIFNVQSLLVFSCFAGYLYAREYEESTMEVTLCYPYPKSFFMIAKLIIMLAVIIITTAIFALCTLATGAMHLTAALQPAMLQHFIQVQLQVILMHFALIPAVFFAAMLTHTAVSGILFGIVDMCLCMTIYKTDFIQFIPPCIPYNLADHIWGMDVMKIMPEYTVHWLILIAYFLLFSYLSFTRRSNIYR